VGNCTCRSGFSRDRGPGVPLHRLHAESVAAEAPPTIQSPTKSRSGVILPPLDLRPAPLTMEAFLQMRGCGQLHL